MDKGFSDEKLERIVKALGGTLPDKQWSLAALYFSYRGYNWFMKPDKGKIEIHVCMPDHNNKAYNSNARELWDACTTSINVSKDKDDAKIIADINRRFDFAALDEAKAAYAKADQDYIDLIKRHQELCDHIAEKFGSAGYRKGEQTMEFSGPVGTYGDITVNLLSVDFIIRGVDSRTSMALIDSLCPAMRDFQKPPRHS